MYFAFLVVVVDEVGDYSEKCGSYNDECEMWSREVTKVSGEILGFGGFGFSCLFRLKGGSQSKEHQHEEDRFHVWVLNC